jgi:hypothetical protein
MKNLLLFSLAVLGLTSCSKDSLDPGAENFSSISKSEIFITVTHLTWSDLQSDLNCSGAGSQLISNVEGAKIDLYCGDQAGNDQVGGQNKFGTTDSHGTVAFKDLEPGQYTLMADTPYGQKSRVVYTQLSRRSLVEFSF